MPEPLGPMTPVISSDWYRQVDPASATTPPNRLRTPLISSTVAIARLLTPRVIRRLAS